jgi:hypothetical protein
MLAVFAVGPIFGLPLIGRYVRTPAELLALFYGLAVAGWALLPQGRSRRRWLAIGVFSLALSVAFIPRHVTLLRGVHKRIELDSAYYHSLRDVTRSQTVRAAFAACAPISAADHRPIPYLRYWLKGEPGSVTTIEKHVSPLGDVLLLPRRSRVIKRFYSHHVPRTRAPAGYETIYRNRSWRVLARPGCAAHPT